MIVANQDSDNLIVFSIDPDTGFLKKEAFIFTILPPGPSPTRPEQSSRIPGAFGQENFLLLFYAWRRSCTTTTVAAPSRLVTLLL